MDSEAEAHIPIFTITVKGEASRQGTRTCCCPPTPAQHQLYQPAETTNLTQRHRHLHHETASATVSNYTTWTPEQLMRDYHGDIKRELFLRCMEWYTNAEVEAKINIGRSDGTKIKNPNFYAEFKRNVEIVALRDGHLPTEYRLQFDRRRFINLEARFGSEHETVRALRKSLRRREAIGFPTLAARPSLQELEAARPDNGQKVQKGRETREYWYKFLAAATETYTTDQIRAVYGMASSTVRQEINRAKRIVARLEEIEQIESSGGSIPQTYQPAPLLLPGQQIY